MFIAYNGDKAHSNTIAGFLLSFGVGVLVGLRYAPEFVAVPYLMVAGLCCYLALKNDAAVMLCVLPYLMYTEMFMRAYVPAIPYLFIPYLYIFLFLVLFLRSSTSVLMHSRSVVLYLLFFLVEFVSYTRSQNSDVAKGLLTNSLALSIIILWGSFNILKPVHVYNILKHVKYAGIYLCGMILARYFKGDVFFSGVSGSEGTNGLAPVQISGYLGFSCILFFFTIMLEKNRWKMFFNIFLFSLASIVMLLSFSRGGLYFLLILMVMYFWLNRLDVKNYFLFLLLIPISFMIYFYLYDQTNGLLIERYEQEGASGREELIKAGWTIFLEEPLAGVGLGNFHHEIVKRDLYQQEAGAHNEFIRVAAEDGLLGVVTYWGFFISLFFQILRRSKVQRDYGLYFMILFCLIVVHNGLKISIQPLLLLLAVATPSLKMLKIKRNAPTPPKLSAGPA